MTVETVNAIIESPRLGKIDGRPLTICNAAEVSSALVERHGLTAAGRMLARLMREAGDAYRERS